MNYNMPCKDCQRRTLGCHAKCEDYAQATAERKAAFEARCRQNIAGDYSREVYIKNKAYYMKRHKKH